VCRQWMEIIALLDTSETFKLFHTFANFMKSEVILWIIGFFFL
jgi:hypothetical protein